MAARALIIAIEKYPQTLPPLEQQLPGTLASAVKFRDWFRQAHDVRPADEPARLLICSDDGLEGAAYGGSAQDIRQALKALAVAGAGQTEELFVFFSGHGFLFKEGEGPRAADVLVASDFTSMDVGGASCLRLVSIQNELRKAMGAGNHYYFVDACRNEIADDQIDVGPLGVRLPRINQKEPLLYTLFSTTRLSTTPAASGFTEIVLDGLRGKGRAKRPAGGMPPRMRVVWASLEEYVKRRLPEADGQHEGTGPAILWEADLQPNTCTITIRNAAPADTFDVTPTDAVGRTLAVFRIQGPEGTWQEAPDDYYLAVAHPKNPVVPIDPPPVDLYDNTTARFEMQPPSAALNAGALGRPQPGAGAPPAAPDTTLTVVGPERSTVVIRDAASGNRTESPETISLPVKPGTPCIVEVFDHERMLIARRDVALAAGEQQTVDLRFPASPLRSAIAAAVPSSPQNGWIDFSESLGGPVTDPDLGVWLSIIAASRVLGYSDFQKLGPLPLHTFENLAPDASAVYVLAGFDQGDEPFAVGLGRSAEDHTWHTAERVPGFPGLFEFAARPQRGGLLVSLASGVRAPITVASYALPNRATVITVTQRHSGLGINQLLLPIGSLQGHLDPQVRQRLPDSPLRAVKFVAQAQRLLARRRSIAESAGPSLEWDSALYGKWLDPMMAIVACYELVRQGRIGEIVVPLGNLEQYFNELPDTVALRQLVNPGATFPPPQWPPLVADGFAAFDGSAFEVLPQSRLVSTHLWTTWRNAVAKASVGVSIAEATM